MRTVTTRQARSAKSVGQLACDVAHLRRYPGDPAILRAPAQLREYESFADRVASDLPSRVLDWGCGLGHMTRLLRDRGLNVTAFDYDADAPDDGLVLRDAYPEIEIRLSRSPVSLPYETASFDAVLSCGVFEHVPFPEASLEEIRRVLIPGGRFYLFKLANRWSYLERIARRLGWYYHGALPDDRTYTLRSVRELLEAHGSVVDEMSHSNLLPLTVTGAVANRIAPVLWMVNRVLTRIPGLNVVATNIDLVATRRT